jgi:hypothetical protein
LPNGFQRLLKTRHRLWQWNIMQINGHLIDPTSI